MSHMSGKICLIVDDEPAIRTFLSLILRAEGFETLEAGSAPQAFKLVEKLKGAIDLVVTDVVMPGDMNGLDLAYAIRRQFHSIPLILISGFPGWNEKRSPEFSFIEKPFERANILETARRLVPSVQKKAPASEELIPPARRREA